MDCSRFIVIEGSEGAGKSTAIKLIKEILEKQGQKVVLAREPGGTPMAEDLRTVVKSASLEEKVDPRTELLIMYAARVQLVENVIRPALERGEWLVCDRFFYSTWAYQGGGRELGLDLIKPIHDICLADINPGLTIFMDLDPELGLERARGRGALDRFELEQIDFFHRTRAMYSQLCEQRKEMRKLDASQSMEMVHQDLTSLVQPYVEGLI
ncbi:dTMP kinase [Lentisphaera profundi]|uniref:Thymidylate kinase n=1 Tax=Lentisphaera profundi TaxID=1658616 RepID=A0ABY7VXX4_9BACT|nr:dTMP kinase [Lentisphaera profundi]WDE99078.1 dTMP kinase [Lentisphaera profundi]